MPRRRMQIAVMSGMNRGQSPCWPGVRIRVRGQQRPVRGQVDLGAQPAAGPAQGLPAGRARGRVLVIRWCPPWPGPRAGRGGPRRHAGAPGPRWNRCSPSSPCPRPHRSQRAARPGPSPRSHPATSGDPGYRRSLLVPEPLRQVPPRAACPGPKENPVDHRPVIPPPAALPGIGRQEHPQALPFLISQVMAFQPIQHRTGLHDPAPKTHGTRPSPDSS